MDTQSFLQELVALPGYQGQMVFRRQVPPRAAIYGELESPLPRRLEAALDGLGLLPFYSHQAQAVDALRSGQSAIVATPSASGKSLCYHIPVLEGVLEKGLRALYIYPTKALAQDQLRSLGQFSSQGLKFPFGPFDGDTPSQERAAIKGSARIVLTNPDMLHLGILPNHRGWSRLLERLAYVVIDEAHIYRGVFGSHMANLLRRLRRLCSLYGSSPQFILCSATLANPGELAERLTGLVCQVITSDGSPYGGKDFVFWNPPVVDEARGIRRSAGSEATAIFQELVVRGLRSIAFARSRRQVELLSKMARDGLSEREPSLATRVAAYRGGYMPEERRRIEKALFTGELLGVAATSALELGIDIGDLEASVVAGYPGSIASLWQQAGRSGRRGERSLSFFVAADNPLDQYLMRHPEAFFGKPPEHALISPENPYILKPHLLCAAYEMPLRPGDEGLFGSSMPVLAQELEGEGLLHRRGQGWHLSASVPYPAEKVNVRSSSQETYLLVEEGSARIVEEVEASAAYSQLHAGAVYLHQGDGLLVKELDLVKRMAWFVPSDVPYYTQAREITDTHILRTFREKKAGATTVYLGEVDVSTTVVGYLKKRPVTEAVLGEEPLDLPTRSFHTVALWFDIPDWLVSSLSQAGLHLAGGLHAAEHAAIGILPLFALCDRNDIGGVSYPWHPDTAKPQVFIHDGHPGGIGISEKGFEIVEELWRATLETIAGCPCEAGCPSCIQSPKCGNNNEPLDKRAAEAILRGVLALDT